MSVVSTFISKKENKLMFQNVEQFLYKSCLLFFNMLSGNLVALYSMRSGCPLRELREMWINHVAAQASRHLTETSRFAATLRVAVLGFSSVFHFPSGIAGTLGAKMCCSSMQVAFRSTQVQVRTERERERVE